MDERSAKRVKISRGDDDYMPGNIVDIEIRNFMTFDKLKCQPASRLNLVVGPNGSGKSSLVCAIALGLGGEPQLLGRASTIGAFVKRGEESGHIKITLKGSKSDEKITIMRKIDVHNKSEWLYNGAGIPKKDVGEIVKKFNIQVNNLTQFLPQDRVCEFAKLTPVQLLEETEKAVGDPRLPVQHRALISKSHELRNLERAVRQNRETLDQLKSLNAEQERDVERVRQREELIEKVNNMKKKLPWLKYDMKKAEYIEAKEKEKDAKKKFDELAKAMNELQGPIEYHRKEKTVHDAKLRKLRAILDGNSKKRLQLAEKENILSAQVRGKFKEMEGLKRQEQSRQERIFKAKEDLAVVESEFANLPHYEPPKDKLENINNYIMYSITLDLVNKLKASQDSLGARILEWEARADSVRSQKRDKEQAISQNKINLARCIDRLRNMEDTKNKSLHALRSSGAERIFEAYKWVNDHRHEFNKDVYGPVLIEVNVKDRVHANYLEGHVAHYIWKAFITQDSADRDFLVQNLMSYDVVVINHVDEGPNKEPFQVSQEMHAIGIYSRLDRVFDAPPAVKDVLIGQFGLEYSYIGSKETDEKANEVQRLGILDLWTPENHYRWSKSRYGDHVSAVVESVNQSRLLLCNVDVDELERLRTRKKELEDAISDLETSLKVLQSEQRQNEDEAAKLQREREDILSIVQQEKKRRRELESRVHQRRSKVKSLETEENLDTIMANLISSASDLNVQRYQCAIEIKNLLIETLAYRRSSAEESMTVIELESKIRELEVGVKEQEKIAVQASQQFEYCKNEVEKFRQQLQAAKKHAESVSMISPDLEKLFVEMPSTIEELEAAIHDTMTEANSILLLNHNILEEYENRQRKIDSLEGKQDAVEVELRRCVDEINALKESWLPTIRNLVAQINDTFSRNFKDMAVAGEVSLDERDIDYENYGILIKVKFREAGELQVLSAHHQSGGERSVSTILYLVSLQDLTNCPFRVVDEINQGMDPVNERKMFQQLVRAASQPNTPQCFLLTPKLLSDLEYSEACSVINVMNGPWIEQSSKAWSAGGTWTSIVHSLTESRC